MNPLARSRPIWEARAMRRLGLLFAMAAAACNGPEDGGARGEPTATPTPTPAASASPTPTAPPSSSSSSSARSVEEETDDFLLEFSYPAEAGRYPAFAGLLDRRLERARQELATESAAARREAREDGFPYNKHSYTAEWKVVADLPRWLSLSGDVSTYSGGAHGNYFFDSLVWDKEAGKAYRAIDLFESAEALDAALREQLCEALNAERAKRREEPVSEDSEDEYDQCVGLDEVTVLVGSSNRRSFDRIGIMIEPYVAGPYAEGAYEFTFRVDRAVLAAVKPEFRGAFTARN
jgi:hypothetical protein